MKSKEKVDVIILYGGHLGPEDLPRIVTEETWETPLGDIDTHQGFLQSLMKRVDVKKESSASGDNTIEVQLAMVKYFFPKTRLVGIRSPLSLRAVTLGKEVAETARGEGLSILAIGSTDLTHYGPNYGYLAKGTGPSSVEWVKQENDKGFIDRALRMDAKGLLDHAEKNESACSAGAAASAIVTCKTLGAEEGMLLDYYTSYDILPDESFVGYAGIIF